MAYCMTTGSYTQALEEQSPTLMARDYKDPPVVKETESEYIVRRLTPPTNAPDAGIPGLCVCRTLGTANRRGLKLVIWTEVFETH